MFIHCTRHINDKKEEFLLNSDRITSVESVSWKDSWFKVFFKPTQREETLFGKGPAFFEAPTLFDVQSYLNRKK